MLQKFDVIIVGSGPAGVSAAFPLVESGLKVLMLDVGAVGEPLPKGRTFSDVRQKDPEQWKMLLGNEFTALDEKKPSSPKCRAPTNAFVFGDYIDEYDISTNNFNVVGSLASGGLSNAWGAGVSCFDDNDLSDFPISAKDLKASYNRIASRIKVSGETDDMGRFHGDFYPIDDPLRLDRNAEAFLSRYKKRRGSANSRGISIGRTRHAVTSGEGKEACQYCGLCLWGCAYGSIYSAKQDLDKLFRYENFTYQDGVFVEKFEKSGSGFTVLGRSTTSSSPVLFSADRVFLAAGAIGSAKIALSSIGMFDSDINLLSTPILAFAMSMPERVGRPIDSDGFSMGQLSFRVEDPLALEGYAFGSFMPAGAILSSEYLKRVPLSYPLSRTLIRFLQSSMLLGNCFLSGSYGRNRMRLTKAGKLEIRGGYGDNIGEAVSSVQKRLVTMLAAYGVMVLPGGFQVTAPGEDIHYAGTLPMKDAPGPAELSQDGELFGFPGVYVVDGAALTTLPAKSHTFTIMANADRIASKIALQ